MLLWGGALAVAVGALYLMRNSDAKKGVVGKGKLGSPHGEHRGMLRVFGNIGSTDHSASAQSGTDARKKTV